MVHDKFLRYSNLKLIGRNDHAISYRFEKFYKMFINLKILYLNLKEHILSIIIIYFFGISS